MRAVTSRSSGATPATSRTRSVTAVEAAPPRAPAHAPRGSPLRSIPAVSDREERYRAIFDSCYQPLQAFARRRAPAADADDLVAEVLTTAWRRLDDIPPAHCLPWLYGVAHRTLANQRRSTARRWRLVQRIADSAPRAPSAPGQSMVLDALDTLRPDDREILRLAAWEDLTTGEIAVALDCTPNAAALRLSRARARLREAMTALAASRTHDDRKVTDG